MAENCDELEICVVCGDDAAGRWFCHFYGDGRRVTLCSPHCAEAFLQRANQALRAAARAESAEVNGHRGYQAGVDGR